MFCLRRRRPERDGRPSALALYGLTLILAACGESAPPPVPGTSLVDLLPLADLRHETSVIDFGTPEARATMISGWGHDETPNGQSYTWGVGGRSRLRIEITVPRAIEMVARATPFLFPGAPAQVVDVRLNGRAVGEIVMDGFELPDRPRGGSVREYRIELPQSAQVVGANELELRYAYFRRPADVDSESEDQRPLAVSWHELRLLPDTESQRPVGREQDLMLPHASKASFFLRLPAGGRLSIERVAPWRDRRGATGPPPALRVEVEPAGGELSVEEFSVAQSSVEGLAVDLPASPERPVRLTLAAVPGTDTAGGLRLTSPTLHAAPVRSGSREVARRPRAERPPNILVYMVDTLRADHLGCYGYGRPTSPHIDRFASDATLFTGMTAQSSWTRPAVASVLTGLNPQVHGANSREDAIPETVELMPEIFQRLGWDTAAVITNGNVGKKFGFSRGFEIFNWLRERASSPEVHALSDEVNEAAFPWLGNRDPERPFLLYLHTTDPHGPYTPRSPFRERFAPGVDDPDAGSNDRIQELTGVGVEADSQAARELRDLYDAEIAFNDQSFGALLDELRRLGLYESTLIVLLSDHGEEFGDHGRLAHGKSLFEEQLEVPLVIRFPGGWGAGKRIDGIARQIDVLPTLLDLAGAEIPAAVQGRSLLPIVEGVARQEDEVSYAYLDLDARYLESVVTGNRKLVSHLSPDGSLSAREELYDLARDPLETVDVGDDEPVWRGYLKSLLLYRRHFWTSLDAPQVEADEELKRRLRAAGYLQ